MKAIFIESGHGLSGLFNRKDVGAVGRFGDKVYYERDIAKELGRRVLALLKTKSELKGALIQGVGIETDATIQKKMSFVNSVMSENHFKPSECLGIAIHMNSSTSPLPSGFEVWHQKNMKSLPLAEFIVRSAQKYNIVPIRPKAINNSKDGRYKRFYIDDAYCPYLIIETAFISNIADVNAIINNYDRMAECLAHGILEYIRSL